MGDKEGEAPRTIFLSIFCLVRGFRISSLPAAFPRFHCESMSETQFVHCKLIVHTRRCSHRPKARAARACHWHWERSVGQERSPGWGSYSYSYSCRESAHLWHTHFKGMIHAPDTQAALVLHETVCRGVTTCVIVLLNVFPVQTGTSMRFNLPWIASLDSTSPFPQPVTIISVLGTCLGRLGARASERCAALESLLCACAVLVVLVLVPPSRARWRLAESSPSSRSRSRAPPVLLDFMCAT